MSLQNRKCILAFPQGIMDVSCYIKLSLPVWNGTTNPKLRNIKTNKFPIQLSLLFYEENHVLFLESYIKGEK